MLLYNIRIHHQKLEHNKYMPKKLNVQNQIRRHDEV